ncbi:MAG TPA: LysR family transcriptional regulator [Kofleriaceae bacterium]
MNQIEQSEPVFSELRALVAVSTHRSFRRAATELGVAPSTLSHAVASLEERLGVKMFHRTTRSVSLSEAGERFLERVRPALDQLAEAMETANDFRATPRGTLRINASAFAMQKLMEPVVLPFLARYPEMRLDIVADDKLVDIVAGGFDAGVRLAEAVPADMVSVPCGAPMRWIVVGAPAYLAKRKRPRHPTDLLQHTCIRSRMPSRAPSPWWFEKDGKQLEIAVDGPLTLDSSMLMTSAALGGVGLAWVPDWMVQPHLDSGALVSVLGNWTPAFPGLCFYYPPHRHSAAGLRALVALIRERFGSGAARVR